MFHLNLLADSEGRRYMRVSDTVDIIRVVANSLESVGVCDGRIVADQLRIAARDLEDKVASYQEDKA